MGRDLPCFIPACRATDPHELSFVVMSRKPVLFASHYTGRTMLCPGVGCCPLCQRELKRLDQVAALAASSAGHLTLLLARADSLDLDWWSVGRVTKTAPWKRGKPARFMPVDKTVMISTDRLYEASDVAVALLHFFHPDINDCPSGDSQPLLSAKKHLIQAAARAVSTCFFEW